MSDMHYLTPYRLHVHINAMATVTETIGNFIIIRSFVLRWACESLVVEIFFPTEKQRIHKLKHKSIKNSI